MRLSIVRAVLAVFLLSLMTGCASHHAVKCDAPLEPINPPHAKNAAEPSK